MSSAESDRGEVAALLGQAGGRPLEVDPDEFAALIERLLARLAAHSPAASADVLKPGWEALDVIRRSAFLTRIPEAETGAWAERILRLVERSHLTTGRLFRQRALSYATKPLFQLPPSAGGRALSWRAAALRVDMLARGLLSLSAGGDPGRVAILSENRLEMALLDLACFSAGIVSVLVPANSTAADVRYILEHAGPATVVVSDAEQLAKVLPHRAELPALRHVLVMDARSGARTSITTLDDLSARGERVQASELMARLDRVRIEDLATIMYTSGTTGYPKGIQFSHRNIVFKRFARALALPEIGEDDVFLCYLPLYHTFGRFLEMLGCVFWGATYCFLDNPSAEALVEGMRRHRPTVFISVPRKWIQLHEVIARSADPETASDQDLLEATRHTTGGRLRFGLSAAGQLSPEIFRFFQRQGIELMSGFGMTEATGGITMTPPGAYRDDSLGRALPGIETTLAEDGELLVRGPYVMMGYLEPEDAAPSFDSRGWFHTGDLMEKDADGFLRLVDRKKEIYKNVKGQTIAPQRIENLFRDFESVGRVFVVGDHREYNTALLYPSPAYREAHLRGASASEVKTHYRSLVVSVNKFLAPYERIVDFAIIDRDLDPARSELTPKLTPRRKIVEQSFADVIRLLYRRTDLLVGGTALTFPNWLFQALGITAEDLEVQDDRITSPSTGASVAVQRVSSRATRVGCCVYGHARGALNLGVLLSTPRLWLGNEDLVRFANLDPRSRERPGREGEGVEWLRRGQPYVPADAERTSIEAALTREDPVLEDLHEAALALLSVDEALGLRAVAFLRSVLEREEGPLSEPARLVLGRAVFSPSLEVRRRAFRALAPAERETRFAATLGRFLERPGVLLDAATREALCKKALPDPLLDAFLAAAIEACLGRDWKRTTEQRALSLLRFVSAYGAAHPGRFRRLRGFLLRTLVASDRASVRAEAARALESMQRGFRAWLGPPSRIAVDPETGQEYGWQDVVVFEEEIEAEIRARLLSALEHGQLLREGVFLLSGGAQVRLSDIPPRGVWIRHLGTKHGKSVYRMTVQTRLLGAHDIAVNVNRSLAREQVEEEIRWLLLCGASVGRDPLVEEFGGFWPEQDLWSEEFIAGDTLERAARRLSRNHQEQERFRQVWPFFAWSALSAFVDFWDRTGRTREIRDPGPANVIIPTHDYHTGARIVSISARRPHEGLGAMLRGFRDAFVVPIEAQYPFLRGSVGWDIIFSSVLEAVREEEGLRLLRGLLHEDRSPEDFRSALLSYVGTVEKRGFLPMRLFFAAKRYRRWAELSVDPTPQARARTLQELYDTYGLERLAAAYPAVRARLFRETVFQNADEALAGGLEEIIAKLRNHALAADEVIDAVSELRARLSPGPEDDYFLARLSFPHLQPEDAADFVPVDLGGKRQSEIMVVLEDQDADAFRVRHALNPKEVGQLHRLFLAAKLDVRFRPEHQYLLALNDRGLIIAGIFYEIEEGGTQAHLEKIVVAERYRKKGVADGLMKEFFHRMSASGVKIVSTGFFRPEFFYSHGFAIEKGHAGLVKRLEPVPGP